MKPVAQNEILKLIHQSNFVKLRNKVKYVHFFFIFDLIKKQNLLIA